MTYREITQTDVPALFPIRAATRENPLSRTELQALGITEASVTTMLSTTHRGWLCEANGEPIGFAMGDGKTGELWVIAVLPVYEGQGIGSRLLDLVETWLWSLGWQELWLWTSSDPTKRAFTFYHHHGWLVSEIKADVLSMKKVRPCV
ncbi:MAG: GCN5-related N-acetyltransferase [Verrucomicrobia bacterium]|jgi:GNAT superfamily N-acetyltransferase|nr:GCN5-related N-acetyltransferase [Verrucomicrobiota bacterium]